jgi:hypothetical protein
MTEPDADRGFEVRDRRRRPDDEPAPRVERPAPAAGHGAPGASPPPPAAEERPAAPPRRPASGQRSLVDLFATLASFAMAALEGVQDPASGKLIRDPQQAAALIDTLMLLREKTEGHRTAEESQTLDELIYDLQLRYVSATSPS